MTERGSILIVGAGLSGLAAAHELEGRHHDVTVLEAQARPGGRILTIREPFSPGLHAEAGGRDVVGDPHLLALIESLGVTLDLTAADHGLATVCHFGGVRSRAGEANGATAASVRGENQEAYRCYAAPAMRMGDARASDWPSAAVIAWDDQSIEQFMLERGASPAFMESMRRNLHPVGEGMASVSALAYLRQVQGDLRDHPLPRARIRGGTDRLIAALAARLQGRVLLGAVVRRIKQDARSVRVTFVRQGELASLSAARVIVTVPFSVLRGVEFDPPLSAAKHEAVARLRYTSVTRAWIETRRPYWLQRGESGAADTDLPLGLINDETPAGAVTGGLLGAYLSGGDARRVSALAAGDRVPYIRDGLEQIHPGLREHFVRGFAKCWHEDPFARGAYCWFAPGEVRSLLPGIAIPHGRCHFAGDHTSPQPGWMHGALASARRAVAEITALPD